MNKQTTEELAKGLRAWCTDFRTCKCLDCRAARVIEAMGKECVTSRNDPETKGFESTATRKARAATDEVIDLKTQEDGR